MSASRPIVLLDDDDSSREENSEHAVAVKPTNPKHDDDLGTFMEITGWSKANALVALEQVGFNLQNALSRVFDEGNHQERDTSYVSSKPDGNAKTSDDEDLLPLHSQWHERVKLMRQMGGGHFVDPEFPPTASSLDGRKHHGGAAEGKQEQIRCQCGLPAAARTVQSDGPNYGRFYLSCGQPRGRYTRRTNNNNSKEPAKGKPCDFFLWDRDGSLGSKDSRWSKLGWHHFGTENGCVLYHKQIGPDQVRQGGIGNCWFLSALSVVAEKPYLIKRLLPHAVLNKFGCYQVNLCLDGKWFPVIVDSSLPVLYSETKTKRDKYTHLFKGGVTTDDNEELVAYPAFAAAPDGQLWPALVEKAYAKAHGSYAQLSGGYIAEALFDLTGAPTETILLGMRDKDELWARLLSFSEAGFLMGVATSKGGDGLVGGHAYSVLEVIEQHDAIVGEQQKVTDFFSSSGTVTGKKRKTPPRQDDADDDVVVLPNSDHGNQRTNKPGERTTIRLVRIRNPWGKREWKGEWSVNSHQWTRALRKRLGDNSFAKGDGTFFMSFDDMVSRFHHMDVAKCREGWRHASCDSSFETYGIDPIESSQAVFRVSVRERTWAFISLVQPKKRANVRQKYWYCDPSMMMLKRKDSSEEWVCQVCSVQGISRTCDTEIFLDPMFEYCCVPFSSCGGATSSHQRNAPFRLTAYSSMALSMTPKARGFIGTTASVTMLHKELLRSSYKLQYAVAPQCCLLCVHGQGCLYFVAVNASYMHYFLLKLVVKPSKGLIVSNGKDNEAHDIRPRTQKILLVASTDGRFSSSNGVSFTYASDVVAGKDCAPKAPRRVVGIYSDIDISRAGDLLASTVDTGGVYNKGGDTVDTHDWIGMLGASC